MKLHTCTSVLLLSIIYHCGGRHRSVADLWRVPWTLQDSTFHNLGYPLIDSLCGRCGSSSEHKEEINHQIILNCTTFTSHQWEQTCHPSSRHGPRASTVIVEPHVIAVEGKTESAGVFVMNAMFPVLYKLGYNPKARYWSELLNQYFEPAAAEAATLSSSQWDNYVEHGGENPFADIESYILFQSEVGQHFIATVRDIVETNDSPYGRALQWMIGLHLQSDNERYAEGMQRTHCIGANFFLAEGLQCTASGVLSCPMFPFHLTGSLAVTPATRGALKQNIVLVDNDAVHVFQPARLQRELRALGLLDVQVLVHTGRAREEVPELYMRTKIALDCCNGGVEFINYEAVLYDVLTLSCSNRATRNAFDFPVPSAYLLEPQRWEEMVGRIYRLLVDYSDHVQAFGAFKRLVRTSQARIETQMDLHLFARDVVFRTWCRTYGECRHVIPWAVAVWTLHPLSRIEVYTSIPTAEFLLDNDVAVQLLRRQFSPQHITLLQYEADGAHRGLHPADFYAQRPCSHVVYLSPQAVLFGRDMLNTHMWALAALPSSAALRPIVHATAESIVLSVRQDRLFARLVKVQGIPDVYLEAAGALRRVESYDVYALLRAHSVNEFRQVPSSYVEARQVGAVLNMRAVAELLAPLPRTSLLPAEPLVLDLLLIPRAAQANGYGGQADAAYIGSFQPACAHSACHADGEAAGCLFPAAAQPVQASARPYYPSVEGPHIWLATDAPLLPVQRAVACLSVAHRDSVVQHLDPIIQNSLMQRVWGVLPIEVREVFGLFDAVNYPNVVSLLDSRHQNWG